MAVKIQFRRDTAANWAAVPTTVLSSGEVGYESDTGNIKIGDGTTQWQNLAYYQLPNVSVNPATTVDLNNVAYRVMGRYRLNSVTGTPFTNAPSDIDSDANSYSTLVVTTHFYSGASPATLTQQTLTQYSDSAVVLKQWVRIYNGTDWTAWSSTSHLTDLEVVTAKIDNLAVTTAKIADLNVTTGKIADLAVTTAKIDDNGVTNAKIRDSAALSVIGRSANSSGDPADIAAANDGEVLRRSGTAIGFGQIANAAVPTNTIGLDKLVNFSGVGILGATAAGAVAALTTQADILGVLDGFGVVHTDNTKVGCIGYAVIDSAGNITQYPSSSFTAAVVSTTRYPRSVAGTWQTLFVRINTGGGISSAQVFGMTTTNASVGVNTSESMIIVAIRTA